MNACRDWLTSCFRSSWKGTPFWTETEEVGAGRRLVIHEFPMRDEPFVEDLGRKAKPFTITAYVASDAADMEAAALEVTCDSAGPGTLVLPIYGPVEVHCEDCSRAWEKDKHGYLAFDLSFIRKGASSALPSLASLANLVFAKVDGLAAVGAANLTAGISRGLGAPDFASGLAPLSGLADHVLASASDGLTDALHELGGLRMSLPLDLGFNNTARDLIRTGLDGVGLPSTLSRVAGLAPSFAPILFDTARAIGDGADPEVAVNAFADLADRAMPSPIALPF